MQIYGLIYILDNNEPQLLALQNVSVKANIVDMISEVQICQTYKNTTSETIEALYKFPIYENSAIYEFEAEIDGDRKIKGIVHEAKEAAQKYQDAVESGHGAYLLEEELPDVFQCSVGNLTPQQTVVIKITYVSELKHDSENERIRFVLPTTIAPRYGSSYGSHLNPGSNRGKVLVPDNASPVLNTTLTVEVTCRMTSMITSIESSSHLITTELNIGGDNKVAKIKLVEDVSYLEKDFILVAKSKDLDQPRAFLEYNPRTETNCMMLTLVPHLDSIKSKPTELIFIIDRSGSMEGDPIKKAKEALELILRSLPDDCIFNVVSFGSKFTSLFPKSEPYAEKTFKKALNHAKSMDASYGGTEIYSALQWVLQTSKKDFPTAIFVITDGQVYNVDQIVKLISDSLSKRNNQLRLFSLGIGNSVSHNLVESISRAGNGYAQFVTTQERMDKKIIGMLKNAVKPPVKDYKITWIDNKSSTDSDDKPSASSFLNFFKKLSSDAAITSTLKYYSTPYKIPILYSGVRFVIYCFLSKEVSPPKHIIIEATCEDGPIRLEVPIDPETLQGSKIHTLGARKMIQDFEEGSSYLHQIMKNNEDNNLDQGIVREQIVDLGKRFSLASRYTSFLAIDERENLQISVTKITPKSELQHSLSVAPQYYLQPQSATVVNRSATAVNRSATYPTNLIFKKKSRSTSEKTQKKSSILSFFSSQFGSKGGSEKQASLRRSSSGFGGVNYMAEMACEMKIDEYNEAEIIKSENDDENEMSSFNVKRGENIEILFNFLRLQSYDGKFLASKEFYKYFDDGGDKINSNLKKSIPKAEEENKLIKEEIWTTSIAIKYLEIVLFPKFKEESEICLEKATKVLKKLVMENGDGCKGNNSEEKVKWVLEKAGEWITKWVNES
ncbi:hypothetical protein Glove_100g22 [Diversispora epigaea]|uniref:VWFA domain-containing protein n=1 Tax=Diversispora epigaea TaxID=1348612 RepID=A0A397JDF8_9GLOM|nr:hypothetical protein Glove_100g22 [Diversispora epigaea]